MIDFSMHKKKANRVTVTGNTKMSLKTESNSFWSEQRTEGRRRGEISLER